MKVVSVINIKGGVAKTTSTVNIAALLASKLNKVLIVDLDPQANATKYLNMYSGSNKGTYEALRGEEVQPLKTSFKVDLLPSNIRLILSESEILSDTRKSRENRMKKWINKQQYDYVFIDCPPSLGTLTTNALVASDYVLVPLKIDKFALDGFEYLLNSIEEIKEEFNEKLKLLGVFVTMDKHTKINKEIKEELASALGDKFFNQTIRENVDVIKSTFYNAPVVISRPKANASKDYIELVKEIESKWDI